MNTNDAKYNLGGVGLRGVPLEPSVLKGLSLCILISLCKLAMHTMATMEINS